MSRWRLRLTSWTRLKFSGVIASLRRLIHTVLELPEQRKTPEGNAEPHGLRTVVGLDADQCAELLQVSDDALSEVDRKVPVDARGEAVQPPQKLCEVTRGAVGHSREQRRGLDEDTRSVCPRGGFGSWADLPVKSQERLQVRVFFEPSRGAALTGVPPELRGEFGLSQQACNFVAELPCITVFGQQSRSRLRPSSRRESKPGRRRLDAPSTPPPPLRSRRSREISRAPRPRSPPGRSCPAQSVTRVRQADSPRLWVLGDRGSD